MPTLNVTSDTNTQHSQRTNAVIHYVHYSYSTFSFMSVSLLNRHQYMLNSLSCYQQNVKMKHTKCDNNSHLPSYTTLYISIRSEHMFKAAAFTHLKPSRRSITKYIQNVLGVFRNYTTLKLFTDSLQSTNLQTLNVKPSAVSVANTQSVSPIHC